MALLTVVGGLFGANTDFGRRWIEGQTQRLAVGPVGYLSIAELEGDLWTNPSVQRLTLSDRDGVWLDAKNVQLSWQASALLLRRVEIASVRADRVVIVRRPKLLPSKRARGRSLSIEIKTVDLILETRPAFSLVDGRFRAVGKLQINTKKSIDTEFKLDSLTHHGDGLSAQISSLDAGPLRATIRAFEANGGALAGSLGLDGDQPFVLKADALAQDGGGKGTLICTSGNRVLAQGQADWSLQGLSAKASVDLQASSLTQTLARHLGPSVRLTLRGALIKSTTYQIAAALSTDTLAVDVNGDVKRDPMAIEKALMVSARSTDLARGFDTPWARTGRFDGQLKGKADAWSLDGTVSADAVKLATYDLKQARGRLTIERTAKALSLSSSLMGTGGQGAGLVSVLLGTAPKAEARLDRLADGQWLLKSFNLSGAGIVVDATGRRPLLGGLFVEGKARLTGLERARAGASGSLNGDWTARKASPEVPWSIGADVKGSAFRSGIDLLDHLLGDTPRLTAKADLGAGTLSGAKIDLIGAASSAQMQGAVAAQGRLSGTIDWRAKGPLPIGPLVIDGAATGNGQLSGSLSAPAVTFSSLIEQVDIPQLPLTEAKLDLTLASGAGGWAGQAALAANSGYGPVSGTTGLSLLPDGLGLQGLKADGAGIKLVGDLSLRRSNAVSANMNLSIGPGVVLSAGKLDGTLKIDQKTVESPANIDLLVNADAAAFRSRDLVLSQGRLTAQGPVIGLDYRLEGRGRVGTFPVRLAGSGQASVQDLKGSSLAFNGKGKLRGADITTLEPVLLRWDGSQRSARGRLSLGGGEVGVEASISGQDLKAQLSLAKVDLGALGEDLAGTVQGSVSLAGRGDQLTGQGDLQFSGARAADAPLSLALDGWIKGRLDNGRMSIDAQTRNGQGLRAVTQVDLPAQASAQPFRIALVRDRAMTGRVDVTGEIKPIWDLFFSGNQAVAGLVDAHGTLGGTLAKPQFQGSADLTKGSFDDVAAGLRLRDLALHAEASADQVSVKSLSANDGSGGTVTGQGLVGLGRDAPSSLTLALKRFKLIDNELVEAIASGTATIIRAADGRATATGDLIIDHADVIGDARTTASVVSLDVIERNRPVVEQVVEKAAIKVPAVALDVRLQAARGIFVGGRGLDAELAMDARVTGNTAAPVLSGKATVVRGEYDFAGKRFTFDDRGVIYLATRPDRIRLDLTATREDTNLTAVIVIKGTAAKPLISLTSTPVLPNDEVLSQVLFGRSASQLSPLEAAQLASAVTGLATGGGLDVIGNLRSFARLDRLALGGGTAGSGVTVSGGKYVTDNIYLELTGGGREGPSAQVEWRVSRRLAVISKLASQGDGKLSVRWRKDERRKGP
jgi:translocation and assembly module TamB